MKSKMTKTTKRAIFICIIIVALAIAAVAVSYFLISDTLTKQFQNTINETQTMLKANERITYVADMDIKAGEVVSDLNASLCQVHSDMDASLFMDESDLGKRALVDISAGSQVLKDFLVDEVISSDMRAVEYSYIYSGFHINEGTYIDVRILYPDGTDYIVLAKKSVEGMGENGELILNVNEDEILLMDSAVVDAWVYSDKDYTIKNDSNGYSPSKMARIYAAAYIQPTLQDASESFYVPSMATMNEMASDPNIVNQARDYMTEAVRAAVEERMFKYISEDNANLLGLEEYDKNDSTYSEWNKYYNQGGQTSDEGENEDEDDLDKYYR